MNKKIPAIGIVGLVLTITSVIGFLGWYAATQRINDLESQISELQRKEKHATVLRSVSAQMEDIAYQQKAISDEKREEALQQTRLANEMRERSEIERQHAIIAQNSAVVSQKKALEAYDQAESQRQIAEHQRIQAEFSKRVADTLSYIALSRSLGSLAVAQSKSGNQEIADMLCYASYIFSRRYMGDVNNPAIFEALTLCSESKKEWPEHDAPVSCISTYTKSNSWVTVSTYGEILQHEIKGNSLKSKVLFSDKKFDFRHVYTDADGANIYAISRHGYLYTKTPNGERVIPVPVLTHPFSIEAFTEGKLLIIGEDAIAEFDIKTNTITATKKLDFKAVTSGRYDYSPILFDNSGNMYIIRALNKIVTKKTPIKGHVTAFASSKNQKYEVYGMDNGTIYIIDRYQKLHRLIGHQSRISKLKTNGYQLYSSSYDGTLNLWITNSQKTEPVTLFSTNCWIMDFTFDNAKQYLWTGDQRGNLTQMLIATDIMADKVKKKLVRNFTEDEWNYYIGKNVPRENFIN